MSRSFVLSLVHNKEEREETGHKHAHTTMSRIAALKAKAAAARVPLPLLSSSSSSSSSITAGIAAATAFAAATAATAATAASTPLKRRKTASFFAPEPARVDALESSSSTHAPRPRPIHVVDIDLHNADVAEYRFVLSDYGVIDSIHIDAPHRRVVVQYQSHSSAELAMDLCNGAYVAGGVAHLQWGTAAVAAVEAAASHPTHGISLGDAMNIDAAAVRSARHAPPRLLALPSVPPRATVSYDPSFFRPL